MSILEDFNTWKDFLSNRLQQAKDQGMSDQTISSMAQEVGDYLSENVEAKNSEEAVLRELWNAASEDEQQAIANSMVRLVKEQGTSN